MSAYFKQQNKQQKIINYMNYPISFLPERTIKPRKSGITMVMDKGLGVYQASDLITSAGHLIDFIKLGFGTSYITGNLEEKINLYKSAGLKVYFGGTLFEAFLIRNDFEGYLRLTDKYKIDTVEISDGSADIAHDLKCSIINKLSSSFTVLSEVGSKDAEVHLSPEEWIKEMQTELQAGSSFVIAEARESGNVGIYNNAGKTEVSLVDTIINSIDSDKILWEAPLKPQQVWFIKKLGSNVNLGNIAPAEIIALETLRFGLRGDTFMDFLPNEFKKPVTLI